MNETSSNSISDLQEVYRQRVLEHSRNPHNFCCPQHPDRQATGFNPLCGDKLTVYLRVDDDSIAEAAFEGTGCAICVSSASMMTDALNKQSLANAEHLIDQAQAMFGEGTVPADAALNELQALAGVRKYPSRIKCALLAWTTAAAALAGDSSQVSTESQDN